jgi:hypothetical protein
MQAGFIDGNGGHGEKNIAVMPVLAKTMMDDSGMVL